MNLKTASKSRVCFINWLVFAARK